jgi:hypothetical protein
MTPMPSKNSAYEKVTCESSEIRKQLPIANSEAMHVITKPPRIEATEQSRALLQLLAGGRADIDEGRIIPAADVFSQIEILDGRNAG